MIAALRARYEADIAEADATINIYLTNPVGIGEHPQHLEEVDKLLAKIADAKDKLESLEAFENNGPTSDNRKNTKKNKTRPRINLSYDVRGG